MASLLATTRSELTLADRRRRAERFKLLTAIRNAALAKHEPLYIYLIQQGTHGPVKIGVAKDPAERLATLQQGNPTALRGLAAWRALAEEERVLHEEFAAQRIRGEWFRPAPEILALQADHGNDFAPWDDPHWDFLDVVA